VRDRRRGPWALLALLLLAPYPALAGEVAPGSARHEALARTLVRMELDAGGYAEMIRQEADADLPDFQDLLAERLGREITSDESDVMGNLLVRVLEQTFPEAAVVEALVPVYMRIYTPEDTERILAFYRTPAGTRMLRARAAIDRGAADAGDRLFDARRQLFGDRFLEALLRHFPDWPLELNRGAGVAY